MTTETTTKEREAAREVVEPFDQGPAQPLALREEQQQEPPPRSARVVTPGPHEAPRSAAPAGDMYLGQGTHSEQVAELVAALALAQAKFDNVERVLEAKIESRREGGRSYTYQYADLATVIQAIRPHLAANGIATLQLPSVRTSPTGSVAVQVTTILAHSSGQWIRSTLTVGCTDGAPQSIGSALTYARRYGLMTMVGIAPAFDEDDDGAAAGDEREWQRREPPRGRAQGRVSAPPAEAPPAADGSERVYVTGVREIKQAGGRGVVYGVKTMSREYYTDDAEIAQAARQAVRDQAPLAITSESRKNERGEYQWVREVSR